MIIEEDGMREERGFYGKTACENNSAVLVMSYA